MEASANVQSGKVNLNKADAPTLQRELSGVGEAKAKAIVSYRESNGPFASAEELLEVKGVGKALLEESREASGELSSKVSLGGRSLTGLFACAPGKARCALATSLAVMASLMTWS
jgi:competence ComEA-like helix-hairpin-helix protein